MFVDVNVSNITHHGFHRLIDELGGGAFVTCRPKVNAAARASVGCLWDLLRGRKRGEISLGRSGSTLDRLAIEMPFF